MSKTVPFLTIQFCISTLFKCKYSLIFRNISIWAIQFSQTVLIQTFQFSISVQIVLFNPQVGPYQVLPFRARVDLGAMAMKGVLHSPKLQDYSNLTIRLFSVISRILIGGVVVLPLCREAVGVFYSPSQIYDQSSLRKFQLCKSTRLWPRSKRVDVITFTFKLMHLLKVWIFLYSQRRV